MRVERLAPYERRRPEESVLYGVVQQELETFVAGAQARERPVPRFVERELRAFLDCGILAHGFVRVHCDGCGHDRLVALSCKGRGFCPSCGGRRMADTATHLVDRVLPEVPIRQWVLTLPYPLRYRCAYDARLTGAVLRAFIRTVFGELRRRARRHWGLRAEQCGAVTFIQRFGSALNLNLHFHTLALDGAYPYVVGRGQAPRFLSVPPPDSDDVARVLAGTARRVRRLIEARAGDEDDALARDEPLLALLADASLRSRIASGPQRGLPWRRLGDRVEPRAAEGAEPDPESSARVPQHGGMSLHADVAVPARDRRRLERLCRYVARPALAHERLEERTDGTLVLRLKTRWRDGTTHILMERSELLERLVPLVPPPRAHQVRYHGILAPGASLRDRVAPGAAIPRPAGRGTTALDPGASDRASAMGREPVQTSRQPNASASSGAAIETARIGTEAKPSTEAHLPSADARGRSRRLRWASLLQRVFEIEALRCPRCGSTMRLIGAIEDPVVARKILACLGLPARAPPLAVQIEDHAVESWDFDQTPIDDEP